MQATTLHLPAWKVAAEVITPSVDAPARITLRSAPVIRNVYSCLFPATALPPEFAKRRPVVVVSYITSLVGPIPVVPVTSPRQAGNAWAVKLERNPSPGGTCDVWTICNRFYTVSCTRLTAMHRSVPRLTPDEFRPIHAMVLKWLPTLMPTEDPT